MAIATLERCYNNRKVFEGVVKIRKGEAVKMILGTSSLEATKAVFKHFCTNVSVHACVYMNATFLMAFSDKAVYCVHFNSTDNCLLTLFLADLPQDSSR